MCVHRVAMRDWARSEPPCSQNEHLRESDERYWLPVSRPCRYLPLYPPAYAATRQVGGVRDRPWDGGPTRGPGARGLGGCGLGGGHCERSGIICVEAWSVPPKERQPSAVVRIAPFHSTLKLFQICIIFVLICVEFYVLYQQYSPLSRLVQIKCLFDLPMILSPQDIVIVVLQYRT